MTDNLECKIDLIPRMVEELCKDGGYRHSVRRTHEVPMPSVEALKSIVEDLRGILFPGYFGSPDVRPTTLRFHIGAALDALAARIQQQVLRGYCFVCTDEESQCCADCEARAGDIACKFIESLPGVRDLLNSDASAAYEGDPAARSPGETIYCYPSMRSLVSHRLAHELHRMDVPVIPRIIAEIAHSETGIDIHPGAQISERFFMDHGTGIVIGETAVIGRDVRIYQGVTLGARSFPLDADGKPVKGIPRHPIVEDGVIIYAGATILGRVTIGKNAVIGGNLWVTHDVAPGVRLQQGQPIQTGFENGGGI